MQYHLCLRISKPRALKTVFGCLASKHPIHSGLYVYCELLGGGGVPILTDLNR